MGNVERGNEPLKSDGGDLQKKDARNGLELKQVPAPEPILEAEKVDDGSGSPAEEKSEYGAGAVSSVEQDIDAEVSRQLSGSPARMNGGPPGGAAVSNGNGLQNRAGLSARKGHTNGNGHPGMRNRRGLSNGEGISNGNGRTLRAKRGISNGNGLSNGNGYVNGRKGITNGRVNGRKGMVNGHAGGKTRAEGGLVDAEGTRNGQGMVNGRGMVNGEGITNGQKVALAEAPPAPRRSAGWMIGAVVLAVVITLLAIFLGLTATEKGIRVDGSFSDWSGVMKHTDDVADQTDPEINIVEYALSVDGSYASFYLKTEGKCLGGSGNGIDSVYVFLDTDQDPSTGYRIDSAGAEYVLVADGYNGHISACGLYRFHKGTDRPSNDWNARSPVGSCRAAVSGPNLECQLSLQDIGVKGHPRMNVLFCTKNGSGGEDMAPLAGTEKAALSVEWSATGPPSIQPGGAGVEVLRVELGAIGKNLTVDSLTVHAAGALKDADVARIAVFSSTGLELPGSGSTMSGGKARLAFLSPVEVPASGTTVVSVVLWPATGAGTGKAIGLSIVSPSDLAASTRAISVEMRSRTMTYIGTGPGAITIDGAFSDWEEYPDRPDPSGDVVDPNIDVTGFKVANDTSSFYFLVRVQGEIMGGAGIPELKIRPSGDHGGGGGPVTLPVLVGEDALFVFLDTDSRVDTGYSGGGLPLGADFMVNITGRDGAIRSQKLHSFTGGADRSLWSWSPGTDISAATDLSRLEAGVPLGGIGSPTGNIGLFYYMTDWRQRRDTGERMTYDMRTQGGRGLPEGGTSLESGGGLSQVPGIDHPPLHAPEFEQILLPVAGMAGMFSLVRRARRRRL